MAGFTWTQDAPAGVYKNHTLSSQLRKASIAETKFMQFVKPEPGYGKKKGESVTITRVASLAEPTDARLSEGRDIPQDDLTITTVAITVSEWGRAVPFTSFAQDLSKFDIKGTVQSALKDQMKLVMDRAAANAFKACKIKAIPDGVSSLVFDTDGTPSTQATANVNMFHVETIRDYMFSTLLIPPYSGDDYIGLIATKGKRGITNDPAWEQWQKYTTPEKKFNSEIGKIENIRFIEVNNTNALSGAKGAGAVLGEAVVFGADAVAMAIVEDPELRAEPGKDFGRKFAVAWYGILEFGEIWDTANVGEAKIIHITSS